MSDPTTMQWIRCAAGRVSTGSGRLVVLLARRVVEFGRRRYQGLAGWVGKSSGLWRLAKVALLLFVASRLRLILVAVGERAAAHVHSGAAGPLLFTAAGLWLVAAYRAGRDGWEPKERPEPKLGEEPPGDVTTPQALSLEKASPLSPAELVAAVRDIGTPHAQLKPLAEHLGTTTDAVRAAAAGMAWAVKDVRMAGRSASAGLRWDEAPSPAEAHPVSGVVGAGQAADDNDDDAPGEGTGERFRVVPIGVEGRIVYDARDTVRRHRVSEE
ncbi:hypothetical protein [Streptomyces sp. NPDC057257]|uniref:hypothetical protein n=1 Tax=Streptomyces sp. NPDC057257 TaxID=3346071 RepID=UPI00363AD344